MQKKYLLSEEEMPRQWYNIQAEMPTKPLPPLNPVTKEPLSAEDLYPVFAEELCRQELNYKDAWIDIPQKVLDMYKYYRCTPLVRAYALEKALGTPAHIYFKNESVSPMGSHKLNSAIPQAYYCKEEGVTNITTETGEEKVILFNLSGHGLIDMGSYDKYFSGDLRNYELSDDEIVGNLQDSIDVDSLHSDPQDY